MCVCVLCKGHLKPSSPYSVKQRTQLATIYQSILYYMGLGIGYYNVKEIGHKLVNVLAVNMEYKEKFIAYKSP